jgi:hypothetical protein
LIEIFDFAFFVFAGANLQPKNECYSEVEAEETEQAIATSSVENEENTAAAGDQTSTSLETENSTS